MQHSHKEPDVHGERLTGTWREDHSRELQQLSEDESVLLNLVNSNQDFPGILRTTVNVYRLGLIFRLSFCRLKTVILVATLFTAPLIQRRFCFVVLLQSLNIFWGGFLCNIDFFGPNSL